MTHITIIGGGPAGLMAAEVLATAGCAVTVYDRMPTLARKFLMAGRGGLNLTHSEPLEVFLPRYGAAASRLEQTIRDFPPDALRAWSAGLGHPTFVGSSGRVFPQGFKASPLLRAWLQRLANLGVRFALRRNWLGWDESGQLLFAAPDGTQERIRPDATLLALGGASWPRLGADGGWVQLLQNKGVEIAPLQPANCGFVVNWSTHFRDRFQGQPIKPTALSFAGSMVQGEAMVTANGLEGGAVYALGAKLREAIVREGHAILHLDLRVGVTEIELTRRLSVPRASQSLATFLRKAGGLSPIAIGLVNEIIHAQPLPDPSPATLAHVIKALPLRLVAVAEMARAISTAGGIRFAALDAQFMLRAIPGVFAAGEMLDWEAPTGGYLLQASFSTGVAAAKGILAWVQKSR